MPKVHAVKPKSLLEYGVFLLLLAATLAAVQGTYATMSEHRAVSARVLQEKFDAKLDVTTYQRDRTADSAWKSETRDIMLDALCARSVDPLNHRCKQR